jgi:regulator of protease activity HflC (stomatin/prohibitin superfamily)
MTPNEMATIAREAARTARTYTRPNEDHVSLGGPLRILLLVVIVAVGAAVGLLAGVLAGPFVFGAFLVFGLWAHRIPRIGAQWEQAVILRFGRFHRVAGPGIFLVFPIADYARFVDTRLLTLEIPHQQVITRDNVPVAVDGVLFFRVVDTQAAVIGMQDYRFAISQYAQASLRDVIGAMTLDELLSEREQIQERIEHVVETRIKAWGIHVDSIRLLDIDMPEELKKMMSRQASAEREKRATITKAEGDKLAAFNLAEAAATMSASPGAMQLRGLQTLDGLGASPSNTVVLAVPVEIYEGLRRLARTAPTAG